MDVPKKKRGRPPSRVPKDEKHAFDKARPQIKYTFYHRIFVDKFDWTEAQIRDRIGISELRAKNISKTPPPNWSPRSKETPVGWDAVWLRLIARAIAGPDGDGKFYDVVKEFILECAHRSMYYMMDMIVVMGMDDRTLLTALKLRAKLRTKEFKPTSSNVRGRRPSAEYIEAAFAMLQDAVEEEET